jgi:hypothetical protein
MSSASTQQLGGDALGAEALHHPHAADALLHHRGQLRLLGLHGEHRGVDACARTECASTLSTGSGASAMSASSGCWMASTTTTWRHHQVRRGERDHHDEALDLLQVARRTAHQLPGLGVVVVGHVQPQDVGEQLLAQLGLGEAALAEREPSAPAVNMPAITATAAISSDQNHSEPLPSTARSTARLVSAARSPCRRSTAADERCRRPGRLAARAAWPQQPQPPAPASAICCALARLPTGADTTPAHPEQESWNSLDRPPARVRDCRDMPTTARLLIEPLITTHAEELVAALDHPAVGEYIGGPDVTTVEAMVERIARLSAGPGPDWPDEVWWNFVVRRADTA